VRRVAVLVRNVLIATAAFTQPRTPPLLVDRLVDAVAEYLCRHRSVGLLRLT
jgi:hypothetical protein